MPNIKSAKKRVLVNAKKANINKSEKSEVKTYIKNFNLLLDNGNLEEAEKDSYLTTDEMEKNIETKNEIEVPEEPEENDDYINEFEDEIDETDEFIKIITQLAWIMMYTANQKIEDYDTFLKSLKNFNISDKWISEVTELAVDCFC